MQFAASMLTEHTATVAPCRTNAGETQRTWICGITTELLRTSILRAVRPVSHCSLCTGVGAEKQSSTFREGLASGRQGSPRLCHRPTCN
jgi:hypothetical protein